MSNDLKDGHYFSKNSRSLQSLSLSALSCLPPYPILKECVARLNGICGMMTGDFTELCCYCTMYSSLDSRMMDFFVILLYSACYISSSSKVIFFSKKKRITTDTCAHSTGYLYIHIQNTKTFFYLKRKSHFFNS